MPCEDRCSWFHTTFAQQRQCSIGIGIIANARDECHFGPQPFRGQRLVCALAAGELTERAARYRLTGNGQPVDGNDDIEIDRPDYNDFFPISHG